MDTWASVWSWLHNSPPYPQPQELTPTDVGLDYREVSVQSTDGLELAGWWVPGNDPSRAVVLISGIEGDKSDSHVVKTASVYAGAGYAVLMIDLRAQGGSEGNESPWAMRRCGTCGERSVAQRARLRARRGSSARFLSGWGDGLAGCTESGVAAVVEDSAYADLPLILRQQLPKVSGLPSFFTPGIFLSWVSSSWA